MTVVQLYVHLSDRRYLERLRLQVHILQEPNLQGPIERLLIVPTDVNPAIPAVILQSGYMIVTDGGRASLGITPR